MSKPTLSKIQAFQQQRPVGGEDYEPSMSLREAFLFDNCAHLLELVERLGEALEKHGDHDPDCDKNTICSCGWYEARALLKEIRE